MLHLPRISLWVVSTGNLDLRDQVPENGGTSGGFAEVLRKCLVELMVHLLGDEVLSMLHRSSPRERVVHGVLGVECSVGDFEVGVGIGCEELDEGRIGVPSPEIHGVDINITTLV